MKDHTQGEVTAEDLGRLARRADALRQRLAARGGASAETSSDDAEISALETVIAAADALRWRRSIEEPIPAGVTDIIAAIADDDAHTRTVLRRQGNGWQCTCGCGRAVADDRIYRWRPLSPTPVKADDTPIVSMTSYRGRQRRAILDDRIRYLAAREQELKEKGSAARFEHSERIALEWLLELATRNR